MQFSELKPLLCYPRHDVLTMKRTSNARTHTGAPVAWLSRQTHTTPHVIISGMVHAVCLSIVLFFYQVVRGK